MPTELTTELLTATGSAYQARPMGWEDYARQWDSPFATVGYSPEGQPYRFPVCSICDGRCGHITGEGPGCTAIEERRRLIASHQTEVFRCWHCEAVFRGSDTKIEIDATTEDLAGNCPQCGRYLSLA